jgi:hypothetical protein
MSFLDTIKSWFSGGSESTATHEPADLPADVPESQAAADLPPAPVDPLGTPMPGTGTATTPPATAADVDVDEHA